MSKIIEMPKSTAQLWSDLFKSFIGQIDRRQQVLSQQEQPTKAVNHEGGTKAVANRKPPTKNANEGAAQSSSAPFQPYQGNSAYHQAQEIVNLDDLGIQLGVYEPDWRDEEPWSDTATEIERQNSIKGR